MSALPIGQGETVPINDVIGVFCAKRDKLLGIALRLVRRLPDAGDTAEDIVAGVGDSIVRNEPHIRGDVETYLVGSVYKRAMSVLRDMSQRRKFEELDEEIPDIANEGQLTEVEKQDKTFWVRKVLDGLPEKYGVVVTLSMDGHSTTEIAESIGQQEGTVKIRKWRGRKMFAERAMKTPLKDYLVP